jgi:hypothetical protein
MVQNIRVPRSNSLISIEKLIETLALGTREERNSMAERVTALLRGKSLLTKMLEQEPSSSDVQLIEILRTAGMKFL